MKIIKKTTIINSLLILGYISVLATFAYFIYDMKYESSKKNMEIFIPDITHKDIIIPLEEIGFNVESSSGVRAGNIWICEMNIDDIDYIVEIYSTNGKHINEIRAKAYIKNISLNCIENSIPFFENIISLTYLKSDSIILTNWFNEEFYCDREHIIVDNIELTIIATTITLRELIIKKI